MVHLNTSKQQRIRQLIILYIFASMFSSQASQLEFEGNINAVLQPYREIIHLDPYNYAAYNNAANIYFQENLVDSAMQLYSKALKIIEDSLAIYKQQADTTKYQKIKQHYHGIILNLGTLYAAVGSEDEAYECYGKIIHDSSDVLNALELLGLHSEFEHTRAQKPKISAAKVKEMIKKTPLKNKKSKGKNKKKKHSRKKVSKTLGRKGHWLKEKISDLLYWIN